MAQKLGYFKEAGLDVTIQTPSDPAAPIKQVAAGRTDLAISYEPEVILAHEQGLDVVAVGALVDTPLTSMIWLKSSKIGGVADLRGKTIATAGIPYQDAYLKTILGPRRPLAVRRDDGQRRLRPAAGDRRRPRPGDARRLPQRRGRRPAAARQRTRSSPRSTSSASRPTTSSSSSPSASSSKKTPQPVRLFLAALARGTAAAAADPQAATEALTAANPDLDPQPDRGRGEGDAAAAEPAAAQTAGRGNEPAYGEMNPEEWEAFIAWMRDHGLISGRPTPVRSAQQRIPTGQDSQVARARPRGSAG